MRQFIALLAFLSVALGLTWTTVGFGVQYANVMPAGATGKYRVFIGYSGYGVEAAWANTWVEALNSGILSGLNVWHIYSVQGPEDPEYAAREIGNSKLIAHLLNIVSNHNLDVVFVAGHSSGSFVAHEFLNFVSGGGLDPQNLLAQKIIYYNLDGGSTGYGSNIATNLIKTYFVFANDPNTGTDSPNAATMQAEGVSFGAKAQKIGLSMPGLCLAGAVWCLHMTMITTHPHFNNQASAQLDYGSIDSTHPVQTTWFRLTGFNPNPPAPVAGRYCVTASPNVNLRSGQCTTSSVITTIPHGASVSSVSCCTTACGYSWRRVNFNGQEGYAADKFLTPCSGATGFLEFNVTDPISFDDPNAACTDPSADSSLAIHGAPFMSFLLGTLLVLMY